MHDSSEDAAIRANNQTAEATRLLVEVLRQQGYRFIRLDAIPQVQSATRVSALIHLRSVENRSIVRADDDTIGLVDAAEDAAANEELLGVEVLGDHYIALRLSNGQHLSVDAGVIRAGSVIAGEPKMLRIEPRGARRIAFQAASGCYISRGAGDRLCADIAHPHAAEVFEVRSHAQSANGTAWVV